MSERFSRMQAAQYLGVSKHTLEVWVCRRTGPAFYKVGRHVFYKKVDLDDFLENKCRMTFKSGVDRGRNHA